METITKISKLKRVGRFLLRNYYKLFDYQDSLYNHSIYGKFRVEYEDGRKSQSMSWKCANDYAKMFKGKVIDNF